MSHKHNMETMQTCLTLFMVCDQTWFSLAGTAGQLCMPLDTIWNILSIDRWFDAWPKTVDAQLAEENNGCVWKSSVFSVKISSSFLHSHMYKDSSDKWFILVIKSQTSKYV